MGIRNPAKRKRGMRIFIMDVILEHTHVADKNEMDSGRL